MRSFVLIVILCIGLGILIGWYENENCSKTTSSELHEEKVRNGAVTLSKSLREEMAMEKVDCEIQIIWNQKTLNWKN
ncbi:MAG: hypothetical protein JKY52_04055 [Flavobacteriales bacterium]|nr:hypothetical protein [Flavobacteriales bacterium]